MTEEADISKVLGLPIDASTVICAPMVNQSELSFRMLCRSYGVKVCFSPMINSKVFVKQDKYRNTIFCTCAEDRPLVVQFCGNDPDILLEAAKLVEDRCDLIDLNLGCPQDIARKGNYGSFLLEKTELLTSIVEKLSKNLAVPVSCKIRLLPSGLDDTIKLCLALQDAGCKLLTVHGRTRFENKQLTGKCDWDAIRMIKAKMSIPVISNGGIACKEDIAKCLKATLCDGVMSSECLLENPAFCCDKDVAHYQMILEYLDICKKYNEQMRSIKPHLFKFLHSDLKNHTEYYPKIGGCKTIEDMITLIKGFIDLHDETKSENCCKLCPKVCPQPGGWYLRYMNRNTDKRKADKADVDPAEAKKPKVE